MHKGKLIVIDGSDGSGKTTQAKLLVTYLRKQNIAVKYYDFPQYKTSFYGALIARYLRGEFGSFESVSPYLISLAYAGDRASERDEMKQHLASGTWIVCNRYTSANMAHQSARIKDHREKRAYLRWVRTLEYTVNGIPQEDLVVYLHVPPAQAQHLLDKKGHRAYVGGRQKDIAESNISHQNEAVKSYLSLAKSHKHWRVITCTKDSQLLPVAKIHERVVQSIQHLIHG
jgi:dTMP kinase